MHATAAAAAEAGAGAAAAGAGAAAAASKEAAAAAKDWTCQWSEPTITAASKRELLELLRMHAVPTFIREHGADMHVVV